MTNNKIIRIYNAQLCVVEKQITEKLSTGKYQLISITYASPSTFGNDSVTEDGWYAFMIDNN